MAKSLANTSSRNKKRIIVFFVIICVLLVALTFRTGWIQIVNADKYSNMATEQQTKDVPISAKRGVITDRNGNELATSMVAYNVWVRPPQVSDAEKNKPGYTDNMAQIITNILNGKDPGYTTSSAVSAPAAEDTAKDETGDNNKTDSGKGDENTSKAAVDDKNTSGSGIDDGTDGADDGEDAAKNDEEKNEDGTDNEDEPQTTEENGTGNGEEPQTVSGGAIEEEVSLESIKEIITNEKKGLIKIAKFVNKDTADKLRKAYSDGVITGIQIAEDVKRFYPKGSFAAHLIGSTTDDNVGMSGIELQYDKYLSGIPGRWIKSTDNSGRNITNGVEKYYQAEDGLDVSLTIDQTIQYYVEKAIDQVQADTQAKRVMSLVMDPETGEVLAMAVTPDFDLNDPRTPLDEEAANYVESLSDTDKITYWNEMWRNPIVNDTYEPGSTFKLITTSIALEEGVTNIDETFTCSGYYTVAGQTLKCWRYYNPHGTETLARAIQNSCNPVQIQLAQRVGIKKYYQYLSEYGITLRTGIDLPGEATPILQSEENAGPVGLATISYGQGIAVTPIELLTAICAIGNDGVLMQPHVVKSLKDTDGNIVKEIEPTKVRQVLSSETANEMCTIMQSVVESGTGGAAYLPGYRVGGKTGTANKVENGKYTSETYSSFVAMAPMDDPKVAVIVIVDSPQGVHFGSQTAGPGVSSILEDTLRYMNVEPKYTESELKSLSSSAVNVPDVIGKSSSEATAILEAKGFSVVVSPNYSAGEDRTEFTVVDQYPKSESSIESGGVVCLYRK